MGEPITRLNPQIESSVQKILLVRVMQLLLSIAMLFPEKKHDKRGQRPYDYRIILVLSILRILLCKTYAAYEIEMRTDVRICSIVGLQLLPGKSTLQRYIQQIKMKTLLEINRILLADLLKHKINLLIDASGIRIIGRSIWFSIRVKRDISRRECDKIHLAVGSDVLFICNWRISNGKCNDSPYLRLLLAPFTLLGVVLADKGYSSRANYQFVADKHGAMFAPFKKNATGRSKGNPAWKVAFALWQKIRTIYESIYHQRSKIECVFSALKKRYGDRLLCRKQGMRRKEMALRFLAYNLRLFICWKYAMDNGLNLYVRA
jgi:hypothetical protein